MKISLHPKSRKNRGLKGKIDAVNVYETNYPLTKPYQLSFISIHEFKTIGVEVLLENGASQIAEVVPLEGYSEESYEFVLQSIRNQAESIIGQDILNARNEVSFNLRSQPFSASPILTAIDQFEFKLISRAEAQTLETLTPFSSDQLIDSQVTKAFFVDGQTYKLKLSGDPEKDIGAFDILESFGPIKCSIRADANQAYTFANAQKILGYSNSLGVSLNIEYFEQLLPINQWKEQKKLVDKFPTISFMLDEPILDRKTIDMALECGVQYVKLKLYKQGGVSEVLDHAQYATDNGLKVIFGNGVASWLSNQTELSIYSANRHLFCGVHEANGYLKIKQ